MFDFLFKKKTRKAYPVFIKSADGMNAYLVFVPDLKIYTESYESFADAMFMARDAIELYYKCGDIEIPEPSNYERAIELAKEDADEDFDYSDGVLTYVDVLV